MALVKVFLAGPARREKARNGEDLQVGGKHHRRGFADRLPLRGRDHLPGFVSDDAPHGRSGRVGGRDAGGRVGPAILEGPEDRRRIAGGAGDRTGERERESQLDGTTRDLRSRLAWAQ